MRNPTMKRVLLVKGNFYWANISSFRLSRLVLIALYWILFYNDLFSREFVSAFYYFVAVPIINFLSLTSFSSREISLFDFSNIFLLNHNLYMPVWFQQFNEIWDYVSKFIGTELLLRDPFMIRPYHYPFALRMFWLPSLQNELRSLNICALGLNSLWIVFTLFYCLFYFSTQLII